MNATKRDGAPLRVYIAGPMTHGEPGQNLSAAAHAAAVLVRAGCAVYVPHLYWLVDAVSPCAREDWMRSDLAWVERSDALLRLPGKSPGADIEVKHAERNGVTVFRSLDWLTEVIAREAGIS